MEAVFVNPRWVVGGVDRVGSVRGVVDFEENATNDGMQKVIKSSTVVYYASDMFALSSTMPDTLTDSHVDASTCAAASAPLMTDHVTNKSLHRMGSVKPEWPSYWFDKQPDFKPPLM